MTGESMFRVDTNEVGRVERKNGPQPMPKEENYEGATVIWWIISLIPLLNVIWSWKMTKTMVKAEKLIERLEKYEA